MDGPGKHEPTVLGVRLSGGHNLGARPTTLVVEPDTSGSSAPKSLVDTSTPAHQISAFSRAVLANIFPNDFLGAEQDGKHNRETLMRSVDEFIHCKKFDNLTLQTVVQHIKVRRKGLHTDSM